MPGLHSHQKHYSSVYITSVTVILSVLCIKLYQFCDFYTTHKIPGSLNVSHVH
jgi:hypothetical protein